MINFNLKDDVRYHNYHIDYRNQTDKWSTNFNQFPGLKNVFGFEEYLHTIGDDIQDLTNTKWHFSIYISIAYVIVIFGLKHLMDKRKDGFNLRPYLFVWNTMLALFSIVGVIRCLPEFIYVLYNHGIVASFCDACYYKDFRLNLWYLFFTLSKSIELFDTIFIVLRKQKLITLHWIHHVLTLNYSWYVFADVPATARWMVNMNFLIHSMMYSYYALKSLRITIPRSVNITITSLQIAQMFAGLYVNYRAFQYKLLGMPCDLSISVAMTGLSLYFLFFLLFVNFFFRTYLLRPSLKKMTKPTLKNVKLLEDMNNNQYNGEIVKKLQ